MNKTNSNFQDNIDSYPKVLIPQFIKDIKNQSFTFKEIYPNYGIPKSPIIPKEIDDSFLLLKSFFGGGLVAFLLLGLFLMIFGMIFFGNNEDIYFSIAKPICIGGTILIATLTTFSEFKHVKKMKNFAWQNYNLKLVEYQKKNEEFLGLKEKINNPDFVSKYRTDRLIEKLKFIKNEILKNSHILEDGAIKKGPSEELFYDFLKKHSDFQVYKSLKFGYYYPDIILIKNNLIIDLEIDEPYTLNTKEPIHYDNIDDSRDKFFLDNDFVVIHFTEEQILKDPECCLDVINEIVESCLNLRNVQKSQRFFAVETPVWTHEMAFDYAYNNSRKNIDALISELRRKYL